MNSTRHEDVEGLSVAWGTLRRPESKPILPEPIAHRRSRGVLCSLRANISAVPGRWKTLSVVARHSVPRTHRIGAREPRTQSVGEPKRVRGFLRLELIRGARIFRENLTQRTLRHDALDDTLRQHLQPASGIAVAKRKGRLVLARLREVHHERLREG